jgi:hypothetical protein
MPAVVLVGAKIEGANAYFEPPPRFGGCPSGRYGLLGGGGVPTPAATGSAVRVVVVRIGALPYARYEIRSQVNPRCGVHGQVMQH